MADLDFSVNANTSSAERNLRRLEDTIGGLQSTLNTLKGAIAGLAIGNFINQTIALGTQLNNLSNATGISADAIRGFQLAVQASGGTTAQASDAVSELVKKIGEASVESSDLQTAFRKVGISLDDLAKLSEEDILKQTVKGLAEIGDKSARSALQAKIFGEALKTVDLTRVNNGLAGFTNQSNGFGDSARAAAEAQRKMAEQVTRLQGALLKVLTPMLDFISKLDSNQIERFIDAVVKLAVAMTALAASFKIFAWLGTALGIAGAAFIALKARMLLYATAATYTNGTVLKTLLTFNGFATFLTSLIPLLGTVAGKFVALAAGVAAASIAINEAIKFAFNVDPIDAMARKLEELVRTYLPGVARIIEGVGSFLGTAPLDPREGQRGRGDPQEIANRDAAAKKVTQIREVQDALQKQGDAIRNVTKEFKNQNSEIIDSINFEKSLVGKSEDYIEVERAREAILKKAADETYKLRQAKAALGKDEQGLAVIYDQQIATIAKVAYVDADRIAKATAGLQGLRLIEQGRIQDIENSTKAIEDRNNREISLGEKLLDLNQRLADVKFEDSLAGMNPLQKQIAQIREDNRKGAVEAGRSFAAQFEGMDLTTEQSKELSDGLGKIADKYKDIANVQIDNLNASRTWGAGWKDAFDEYVDNATNAANTARDLFKSMTSTIEDSLVDMAKTGKFQWKTMLASMAEDLLRSQIRQLISGLVTGKSSGGSVIMGAISGVGKLLGFANGGVIPTNGPVVVGERGPELLTGAAGRTVIPNHQMGGSTVTYNINAVDALSFKQMIAKDPSFIHAVATQGGKSIPGTRR